MLVPASPVRRCASCQEENPPDGRFCLRCGQTLVATGKTVSLAPVRAAPAAGAPVSPPRSRRKFLFLLISGALFSALLLGKLLPLGLRPTPIFLPTAAMLVPDFVLDGSAATAQPFLPTPAAAPTAAPAMITDPVELMLRAVPTAQLFTATYPSRQHRFATAVPTPPPVNTGVDLPPGATKPSNFMLLVDGYLTAMQLRDLPMARVYLAQAALAPEESELLLGDEQQARIEAITSLYPSTSEMEFLSGAGEVAGAVAFRDGSVGLFLARFVYEGDAWKLRSFSFEPAALP
jgi:hypothetical protein